MSQNGKTDAEIKEAFAVFDKNGDGTVTAEEVRHVLLTLGEDLANVDEMIKSADANGDGVIDYNEFSAYLKASKDGGDWKTVKKHIAAKDVTEDKFAEVHSSWAKVEGLGLDNVGVLLFKNIFEIAPGALASFPFREEKPLYESKMLINHGKTVVGTVGKAVAGLRDVDKLIPVLHSLGKAHAVYGVAPEHFAVVGQALLKTLKMGLGDGFTPSVEAAWTNVYGVVSGTMIKGLSLTEAKAASEKELLKKMDNLHTDLDNVPAESNTKK